MECVNLCEIGKRIQTRRKQLGITQEQLANLMDVSIQMVSNLERGNKSIRIENLVNLSRILQVSTDYILTGENTQRDNAALLDSISRLPDKGRRLIENFIDYCVDPE